MEDFFQEFKKNFDRFLGELDETNSRFQKIFQERFDEIKEAGGSLKKEIKNKERWDEVDTALRRVGNDIKKVAQAVFSDTKKGSAKRQAAKKTTKKSTVRAPSGKKTARPRQTP